MHATLTLLKAINAHQKLTPLRSPGNEPLGPRVIAFARYFMASAERKRSSTLTPPGVSLMELYDLLPEQPEDPAPDFCMVAPDSKQ